MDHNKDLENIIRNSFGERSQRVPEGLWGKLSSALDNTAAVPEPVQQPLEPLDEKVKESFSSLQEEPARDVWPAINKQLNIDQVWQNISRELDTPKPGYWPVVRVAAAVLLLLLSTTVSIHLYNEGSTAKGYLTNTSAVQEPTGSASAVTQPVSPQGASSVSEATASSKFSEGSASGKEPKTAGTSLTFVEQAGTIAYQAPSTSASSNSVMEKPASAIVLSKPGASSQHSIIYTDTSGAQRNNGPKEKTSAPLHSRIPSAEASVLALTNTQSVGASASVSNVVQSTEVPTSAPTTAPSAKPKALALNMAQPGEVPAQQTARLAETAVRTQHATSPAKTKSEDSKVGREDNGPKTAVPLTAHPDVKSNHLLSEGNSQSSTADEVKTIGQHAAKETMSAKGGVDNQAASLVPDAGREDTNLALESKSLPLHLDDDSIFVEEQDEYVDSADVQKVVLAELAEEQADQQSRKRFILKNFEVGLVGVYHNSWLLNNETRSSFDDNSLIATDRSYKHNFGVLINYKLSDNSVLTAELHLVNKAGQHYRIYNNGEVLQKNLELRYQKLYVQYQQNFLRHGRNMPGWFTAKAGVYGGKLQSKLGEIRQEQSSYSKYDYGFRLAAGYEKQLGKFILGYGLSAERGLKNVFMGTEKMPASFNKTYIMNFGTYLNCRYSF